MQDRSISSDRPGPSLFDRVRTSCAAVARQATLVRVNHEQIAGYARTFDVAAATAAAREDRLIPTRSDPTDPEQVLALILASVAVNFTSGWHDIMPKRPGLSGAVSTVARLRDWALAHPELSPAVLASVTPAEASTIFELPLDHGPLDELAGLLADTLNELGNLGLEWGNFATFVSHADGSARVLAAGLGALPSFHDIAHHHDAGRVDFYKRAQMAVAALNREFGGAGLGGFHDIDQLTIFADNLVPHVLRLDGLITVHVSVEAAIDAGELLDFGSQAEVEIRAAGVHAAELLSAELANQGKPILTADLDRALWTRGGEARYKSRPRHRCRNRYY